jgi:hypothetical protein
MADLRELRDQYRNLRSAFEREMEIEFARRSAVLNDKIDTEVWRLRDSGISIAKIGNLYGSKNYGTIKEILDRRPTNEEKAEENAKAVVTRIADGRYIVSLNGEDVDVEWDFDYHAALMFHGTFDSYSPLVIELRKENNAYAAQIEAI